MPSNVSISKKEVEIRQIMDDLKLVLNDYGNYVGVTDYIQRLLGYNERRMREIDDRVRDILFQRANPLGYMTEYIRELLKDDKRFRIRE
jgi:hypothetical protein